MNGWSAFTKETEEKVNPNEKDKTKEEEDVNVDSGFGKKHDKILTTEENLKRKRELNYYPQSEDTSDSIEDTGKTNT